MSAESLIPIPDTIPAPFWIFDVLGILFFLIHITLVNIVVGTCLITLFSGIKQKTGARLAGMYRVLDGKLTFILPFAITIGVAPLLFVQVVYGHFFYTSSVFMAVYWIAVIPVLILGYYGLYGYTHFAAAKPAAAKAIMAASLLGFLYIAFIYTCNFTLMSDPGHWNVYFQNRSGTILNFWEPTLAPRLLHFVAASVAVAALCMAVIGRWRQTRDGENSTGQDSAALRLFGMATLVQVFIGFWFLFSLPAPVMMHFMGQNTLMTAFFLIGFLAGIGAIATAFAGKLKPTVIQLLVCLLGMVITRYNLKLVQIDAYFSPASLKILPQYDVLAVFLVVFIAGLAVVYYMLRIAGVMPKIGGAR